MSVGAAHHEATGQHRGDLANDLLPTGSAQETIQTKEASLSRSAASLLQDLSDAKR